jgi:hypothetical protein
MLQTSLGTLLARAATAGCFVVKTPLLWLAPSLPGLTPTLTFVQRRFDCSHRLDGPRDGHNGAMKYSFPNDKKKATEDD